LGLDFTLDRELWEFHQGSEKNPNIMVNLSRFTFFD
jgi:hypothetical protein